MDDANQRDHIRAPGQRIDEEIAGEEARPLGQSRFLEPGAGALHHGRQIEEHQLQPRRARRRRGEKGAFAAADVEQRLMAAERIDVEQLLRHQRLRGGHQRAIGRDLLGGELGRIFGRRIGPIIGEPRLRRFIAAQQSHGIGEIGVEHGLMRDERERRRIADERRAELAEAEALLAAPLDEAERGGGVQQPRRGVDRELELLGDLLHIARLLEQKLQELQPHAGEQHLRIDEAGAEIEHVPRAPSRLGAGQRMRGGEALEARARHEPIPETPQPVPKELPHMRPLRPAWIFAPSVKAPFRKRRLCRATAFARRGEPRNHHRHAPGRSRPAQFFPR